MTDTWGEISNRARVKVELTGRQLRYLWTVMRNHVESSSDDSVIRDSERLAIKFADALRRKRQVARIDRERRRKR